MIAQGESDGFVGSTAAPSAVSLLAGLGDLPQGIYRVVVITRQSGTHDGSNVNMRLRVGDEVAGTWRTISDLLSADAFATHVFDRVELDADDDIQIVNPSAGGAGSVYDVHLTATRIA